MKLLCTLAYWVGAAIMGLFFLPFILVAVLVGLGSYFAGLLRKFLLRHR